MLTRTGRTRIHPDGPVVWGWIRKVMHMVRVERIAESELYMFTDKQKLPLLSRERKAYQAAKKERIQAEKTELEKQSRIKFYERMESLGLKEIAEETEQKYKEQMKEKKF